MNMEVVTTSEGGALTPVVMNTLNEVLTDPEINQTFGNDGKLSRAQAGLVAAVTVKMQDRLIETIHNAHQRELALLSGLWKLYRTPVIRLRRTPPESTGAPPKKNLWGELFSWGNLIGGSAIVIAALAYYFTSVTANYKTNWENAETEKKELADKYKSEIDAATALNYELGKAQAKAEELDKVNNSLTSNSKDLGGDLRRNIEEVSRLRGELSKQSSASDGEKKFQKLWENDEKELRKLRDENSELHDRIDKLNKTS